MSAAPMDFDAEADLPPIDAINVTPLVDVMLVLLVVFLVTLPPLFHAADLQLPQASAAAVREQPHVDLRIAADGRMRWDGQAIEPAALPERLRALATAQPQAQLRVWADGQVAYERVAQVLAAAQQAAFTRLAFVTEPAR